ncbi:MAG: response regulator transcription factor [Actinomycetota bacterium]
MPTDASEKRILVADDDPVILRLIQVNLELEGYQVLTANNGEEAVETATAEHPDLVILDIMMPRMDGYQACETIKSEESTKDIPIVFLSAKAQQSDIDKGKAYGVDDYLTKPFDPAELIEVVERLTA